MGDVSPKAEAKAEGADVPKTPEEIEALLYSGLYTNTYMSDSHQIWKRMSRK